MKVALHAEVYPAIDREPRNDNYKTWLCWYIDLATAIALLLIGAFYKMRVLEAEQEKMAKRIQLLERKLVFAEKSVKKLLFNSTEGEPWSSQIFRVEKYTF